MIRLLCFDWLDIIRFRWFRNGWWRWNARARIDHGRSRIVIRLARNDHPDHSTNGSQNEDATNSNHNVIFSVLVAPIIAVGTFSFGWIDAAPGIVTAFQILAHTVHGRQGSLRLGRHGADTGNGISVVAVAEVRFFGKISDRIARLLAMIGGRHAFQMTILRVPVATTIIIIRE